jgi:sugar-specific transcriptional regulator TrmB
MNRDQIIEELRAIGFNEYKAKVFLTLSSGKIMSATEIVEQAKIARGSIYDILKSFVLKGYCNEIETNRILQYQIIDPDIVLDKILKEYNEEHNSRINSLQTTFREIKKNYFSKNENGTKNINVELIRGFNQHRIAKYKEFLESAEKEILGMYTFKGIISDESDEMMKTFISKGGKIKSIYRIGLDFKIQRGKEVKDSNPDDLIDVLKNFESIGEQIRVTSKDIPNMTIIDNLHTFVNINDKWIPRHSQVDVIFRQSNFTKYLKDLFEFYWGESMDIESYGLLIKNNSVLK